MLLRGTNNIVIARPEGRSNLSIKKDEMAALLSIARYDIVKTTITSAIAKS